MLKPRIRLAGIALGAIAAGASAQTIDFQALEMNDAGIHDWGYVYQEDGYTLFHDQSEPFEFRTFGTQSSAYPGSTALFNNTVNGVTELVKDDGGAFSLFSIELSNLNGQGPVTVNFSGFLNGNLVATDSFTTSNQFGNILEEFVFNPDFANVDHVTWVQESPFHQFDNITVAPIPAPGTLAVAALVSLYAPRRRR